MVTNVCTVGRRPAPELGAVAIGHHPPAVGVDAAAAHADVTEPTRAHVTPLVGVVGAADILPVGPGTAANRLSRDHVIKPEVCRPEPGVADESVIGHAPWGHAGYGGEVVILGLVAGTVQVAKAGAGLRVERAVRQGRVCVVGGKGIRPGTRAKYGVLTRR